MRKAEDIEPVIREAGFEVLGWLDGQSGVTFEGKALCLVGNAGSAMYERFASERKPGRDLMDDWTRDVIGPLAALLNARAVYPFDKPHPPVLTWARAANAGHTSPLGMNIHPTFGLWHAYRAVLLFDKNITLNKTNAEPSPCDSCADRPCLSGCPVKAFDGQGYDVEACAAHLRSPAGAECRNNGCLARRACPVGNPAFLYSKDQTRFHMVAFMKARGVNPDKLDQGLNPKE